MKWPRLGNLLLIVVAIGLGSCVALVRHEASSTPLTIGQFSNNYSVGPSKSISPVFDFAIGFTNPTGSQVALKSVVFGGGLPDGLSIEHVVAAPSPDQVAVPTLGWPPQSPTFSLAAMKPVAGYRVPPHSSVVITAAVRAHRPGCYYVGDPTITSQRTGLWSVVPFVGAYAQMQTNWVQRFCVGQATVTLLKQEIGNLLLTHQLDGGDHLAGEPIRFEAVTAHPKASPNGVVWSGRFADQLSNRSYRTSWFTGLTGVGDFDSTPLTVATDWVVAVSGGSCSPGEDPAATRIWTQAPNSSHRYVIVGAGGLTRGSGGSEAGPGPKSGPVTLHVRSTCSWHVDVQTTSGPITLWNHRPGIG